MERSELMAGEITDGELCNFTECNPT